MLGVKMLGVGKIRIKSWNITGIHSLFYTWKMQTFFLDTVGSEYEEVVEGSVVGWLVCLVFSSPHEDLLLQPHF